MMAEKRAEDNVRPSVGKGHPPVIRTDPLCLISAPSLFCYGHTMYVEIDARDHRGYAPSTAPPVEHPQIVSAATAYFADAHLPAVADHASQPFLAYRMTAQQGIDHIQFPHVLFDIRKGDIVPVQQLFLAAPL